MTGCTMKLNVWLRELPNFTSRPGTCEPHHYGQLNTPLSKREWIESYTAAEKGHLPDRLWTEIYFQSVHDRSVAPQGTHTMSMFTQYVPYQFAHGSWDSHREQAKRLASMPWAVFAAIYRSGHRCRSTWAAGHREKGWLDGRPYFPWRVSAFFSLEQPITDAHADERRLSMRCWNTSGRKRDCYQWPERCDGRTRRFCFNH